MLGQLSLLALLAADGGVSAPAGVFSGEASSLSHATLDAHGECDFNLRKSIVLTLAPDGGGEVRQLSQTDAFCSESGAQSSNCSAVARSTLSLIRPGRWRLALSEPVRTSLPPDGFSFVDWRCGDRVRTQLAAVKPPKGCVRLGPHPLRFDSARAAEECDHFSNQLGEGLELEATATELRVELDFDGFTKAVPLAPGKRKADGGASRNRPRP